MNYFFAAKYNDRYGAEVYSIPRGKAQITQMLIT